MTGTRCGIIAIIGEPNAGKSTLINQLVGGKVSIVTPKVQTTRFNIRGVCAYEQSQFIFVDTPGIFEAGKPFEKAMVRAAWSGMGDADAVLMVLDGTHGLKASTEALLAKLPKGKPVCLAINKIDRIKKDRLMELASACDKAGSFDRIFMVSALKGSGVEDIKKWLAGKMPETPWLYPEDEMSDIPMRMLAAEVTREKLFLKLEQELPYSLLVETENWEEKDTLVKIAQIIYVQRDGQKKIVIGQGGDMLKRVGTAARKELETLLDKKVHLSLFVKVSPGWKEDSATYRMLGLEYKK